nr:FxsA family protein [Halothermothrix orenii]
MLKLIFILTVIPLAEISLLVKLSHLVGFFFTIFLVAITGFIGAFFVKQQGTKVIKDINTSLSEGRMPVNSLIDGFLIFTGGILLITPGLLTDLSGLGCVLPFSRKYIKPLIKNRLSKFIRSGRFSFSSNDNQGTKTVEIIKEEQQTKK